ncbi:hypothetical protein T439DRAFT_382240 [Meredithblackwellia eburnea MCA 4105]
MNSDSYNKRLAGFLSRTDPQNTIEEQDDESDSGKSFRHLRDDEHGLNSHHNPVNFETPSQLARPSSRASSTFKPFKLASLYGLEELQLREDNFPPSTTGSKWLALQEKRDRYLNQNRRGLTKSKTRYGQLEHLNNWALADLFWKNGRHQGEVEQILREERAILVRDQVQLDQVVTSLPLLSTIGRAGTFVFQSDPHFASRTVWTGASISAFAGARCLVLDNIDLHSFDFPNLPNLTELFLNNCQNVTGLRFRKIEERSMFLEKLVVTSNGVHGVLEGQTILTSFSNSRGHRYLSKLQTLGFSVNSWGHSYCDNENLQACPCRGAWVELLNSLSEVIHGAAVEHESPSGVRTVQPLLKNLELSLNENTLHFANLLRIQDLKLSPNELSIERLFIRLEATSLLHILVPSIVWSSSRTLWEYNMKVAPQLNTSMDGALNRVLKALRGPGRRWDSELPQLSHLKVALDSTAPPDVQEEVSRFLLGVIRRCPNLDDLVLPNFTIKHPEGLQYYWSELFTNMYKSIRPIFQAGDPHLIYAKSVKQYIPADRAALFQCSVLCRALVEPVRAYLLSTYEFDIGRHTIITPFLSSSTALSVSPPFPLQSPSLATHVRTINLHGASRVATSSSLATLKDVVSNCPNLKNLDLKRFHVGYEDWVVTSLPHHPSLKFVKLDFKGAHWDGILRVLSSIPFLLSVDMDAFCLEKVNWTSLPTPPPFRLDALTMGRIASSFSFSTLTSSSLHTLTTLDLELHIDTTIILSHFSSLKTLTLRLMAPHQIRPTAAISQSSESHELMLSLILTLITPLPALVTLEIRKNQGVYHGWFGGLATQVAQDRWLHSLVPLRFKRLRFELEMEIEALDYMVEFARAWSESGDRKLVLGTTPVGLRLVKLMGRDEEGRMNVEFHAFTPQGVANKSISSFNVHPLTSKLALDTGTLGCTSSSEMDLSSSPRIWSDSRLLSEGTRRRRSLPANEER